MRTAIDTNILSGLLSKETHTPSILQHLAACRSDGQLLISPVVYAEILAHPRANPSFIDTFLRDTGVVVHPGMDLSLWLEAGTRYARYAARRRQAVQQNPRRIIADFLIGAHALVHADRLMTFDTTVYRQDFPELRLYPEPAA